MKLKDKIYSSSFLGKQLSRLKLGQSYYGIVVSTISAIALLKLAFNIDLMFIIVLFPVFLFVAFFIGYYLDVKNIISNDVLKANEIANRFLNTSDRKNQEFQLLMMQLLLEGLNANKYGKEFDESQLMERYKKYEKKWAFGGEPSKQDDKKVQKE